MGRSIRFQLPRGARETLHSLEAVLHRTYGAPEEDLANKHDPLDEAVYIILSFQTDLSRVTRVWADLPRTFPSWSDLECAPLSRVARVLHDGGLHEQKARTIRQLLKAIRAHTGSLSLDALHSMTDADAEAFLTRLPGLSWKGARCVLLYSLDRAAFPVDSNTFRIFHRAGIIARSAIYRRKTLHDGLQNAVAPQHRRRFHVNLVVHGQRTCLPKTPCCPTCPARRFCAMRGVPTGARAVSVACHADAPARWLV